MPAPPSALQRKQYQIFIERAPEAVFAFHANLANHARLCPADQTEEILSGTGVALAEAARMVVRSKRGALGQTLIWEVADWHPHSGYALRQVEGPFAAWINRRKFTPFQGGTLLADQIEYAPPTNPLALLGLRAFTGAAMDKYFQFRHTEAKRLLERIGRIKGRDAV